MRSPIDAWRSLKTYASLALGDEWEVRLAFEEGAFRRPFCRVDAGVAVASGPAHTVDYVQPFSLLCHPAEQPTADLAVLESGRVAGLLERAFRVGAGRLAAPAAPTATATAGALAAGTHRYVVTATTRSAESPPSPPASLALAAAGGVQLAWTPVPGAQGYRVYRGAEGTERLLAAPSAPPYLDAGAVQLGSAAPPPAGRGTLGGAAAVPLWDWDGVPIDQLSAARSHPDHMRVVDLSVNPSLADPNDELLRAVACDVRLAWRRLGRQPSEGPDLASVRVEQQGA